MKTLISEEFEWEAREEAWADVEALLLSQTREAEDVEDCPPLAMLMVIVSGVALTSVALIAFLGG